MAKNTSSLKLTNKSNRFLRFYVSFVWVLLAACIVGWFLLFRTLTNYEGSLPVTFAKEVIRETKAGDFSTFAMLDDSEIDALAYYVDTHDMHYAEVKELSREKGDYKLRITVQGSSVVEFTITPYKDHWKMISAKVNDNVINEHLEMLALQQTELVKERIASCDYSDLYAVFASTGYAEDTLEAFQSFMLSYTPEYEALSFVRNDVDCKRGYDIVLGNSRFGSILMSKTDENKWQIDSFSISASMTDAYILYLADMRAGQILDMVRTVKCESLYEMCVASGYPENSLEGFSDLLRNTESLENATCSLFADSTKDSRNYLIATDNQRIAAFSLTTRPSETSKMWIVSSFEMPVWIPFEGTVTAPACFTVTVDGKTLTEADEISREVQKDLDPYLIDRVPDMVTDVTYRITTPFPPESISAVSDDGRQGRFIVLDDHNFRLDFPYCDEDHEAELHDFLVKFSTNFGLFTLNDVERNSMMNYIEQNTTAYTNVYRGDYAWVKAHYKDKTEFANFKADNFVCYDDDTIACDIHYDMTVVYRSGDTVETYHPAYRVYLRMAKRGWRIFSFNSITEE